MRKDYEKLFTHLKPPEPPEGLFEKIIHCVLEEQHLFTLKKRATIFFIAAVGSFAALIPAFEAVRLELVQSGLAQFISLILSDPNMMFTIWNDFIFSILESLPILSMTIFLGAIFIFLGSLKFLARDLEIVMTGSRLIRPVRK